ncbi:neuropeptide F receptor [Onthophagus taurus]|uniref:neuropeptide F receptor n=1 Tax=Onthophagus taurus TaxID=166361 RepID=UPI000C2076F5|nr:neuropeptide F receptor [Onthophagus taurus]
MELNISNGTFNVMDYQNQFDNDLVSKYMNNRAVGEPAFAVLIILYSILILIGALGNMLVIVSVIRKPSMRTPRNMFIVNLAISDLLLCTVTMPLTLMEVLTKYWPLGNYATLCQMKNTLQTVSVFVTATTIAAIALDRYRVIVYPTRESPNLSLTGIILFTIWCGTLFLASPMFAYTTLIHHDIKINDTNLSLNFCIEDWPFKSGRAAYTVFALIFQYLVPIFILSGAYLSIYLKLRYRFATGFVSNEASQNTLRRQTRGRRLKRTNILLVSITVIFCISWLPLHVFNLIADTTAEFYHPVPYAVCHMISMSSACSNPILYGWLNENFWKEFKDLLCFSTGDEQDEQKRSVTRKSSKKIVNKEEKVALEDPGVNCSTEMSNFATS